MLFLSKTEDFSAMVQCPTWVFCCHYAKYLELPLMQFLCCRVQCGAELLLLTIHHKVKQSYARSYKHGLRRPLRAGVALVKGTDSECSLADQPGLDRPKAIRSRSDGDSQSMSEHANAQPPRIDS